MAMPGAAGGDAVDQLDAADLDDAMAFVKKAPWGYPFVVKADGLAAGKGSVIVEDAEEARTAVEEMMSEKRFGSAGAWSRCG